MSVQPLFLDRDLDFEKVAGMLTKLSDNIDTWPQEVMQEAYKSLPYLSNFEVNVVLDKIDEGRGYAFGSIEVRPQSQLPEETRRSHLEMVHIPILVKEQMMCPLDIFIYGKRYSHLTEGRLRAALFRPDAFDSVQDRPPESIIGTELQPPAMAGHAYGGVKIGQDMGTNAAPATAAPASTASNVAAPAPTQPPVESPAGPVSLPAKTAAVLPILPQLHGRVNPQHIERLKTAMQDPSLQRAYTESSDGVRAALSSALHLEPSDPVKTAAVVMDRIKPTTVQLSKMPNGHYLMKWANAEAYAPQQQMLDPMQAQDMVGPGMMGQQLQDQGSVTANPDAQATGDLGDSSEIRVADQFGMWLVQDTLGNQILGWVFPHVLSLDMQRMPMALFTNGSQYGFQVSVAGKMLGKATDIPTAAPKGYGALFFVDGGTAKAFVPMTVTGSFMDPMGMVHYSAETDMGEQVSFFFSNNVKTAVRVADGQIIVPSNYKWMPLKARTDLVEDPGTFMKTASRRWASTVEILGDSASFSFRGPAVAKLASAETKFVNRRDAEFLGSVMGIEPRFLKMALDEASKGKKAIHVDNVCPITPVQEKYAEAKLAVVRELSSMSPKIHNFFLVKEASVLDDALVADKVLGLGFINAENISTFVDMLPGLEEASSKLAELLLAVRVGLKDVPEIAVERMLAAIEDVISGLRTLKQKEIRFGG